MTFRSVIPAIVAVLLAGATVSAAPIAPLPGVSAWPAESAQFRGGNWHDHPLMYQGNWDWHQRQWNGIEGRGGRARANPCARFRSYDRATHTYRGKNGRRIACP